MYSAVCADCGKECQVPFEPSQGRPVYCQECYARRRQEQLA
jgi:CxxC-x17-CxxC domain-containing protein